ncbi:MAG: mechanosensitive ion channel family protein [Chitinophagales bacterium]
METARIQEVLENMLTNFLNGGIKIAIGLIVLFIAWFIAKFISGIIRKVLKTVQADRLGDKLKEVDMFSNIDFSLSDTIAKLIFWVIILVFMMAGAQILGITSLADGIAAIIAYLPKLFSALIFFLIGVMAANLVKSVIDSAMASLNISAGRFISGFIFYLLVIVIGLTALEQASFETEILKQITLLATGAVFFAFALGYGFASKDIMANMLASFYGRDKFTVGQRIKVDAIEGIIIKIDNTSVTVDIGERKVIMPINKLLNSTVEIF